MHSNRIDNYICVELTIVIVSKLKIVEYYICTLYTDHQ